MPYEKSSLAHKFSLNKEQLEAVTHPQDVPLQILAGPGSGKTRVLASRVAYLVQEHHIPPSQICCVTFTNKAANEMRERLNKFIGIQQTNALVMGISEHFFTAHNEDESSGTFHAICAKFLRQHGSLISLPNNFTICDAEESKKTISKIMKSYADELSAPPTPLKETAVLASISKAKAKGIAAHQLGREKSRRDPVQEMISRIYAEYDTTLEQNNSLDFDDILIFGVKLFRKEPKTLLWCHHVLVDEFQDTNSMQYELMVRLASAHRCITVVGDPDQSIYGWRSAEITNLTRMRTDFPSTRQIFLEENYRSTGSILAASLAIVAEDKTRIAKSLRTSHPRGELPTLRSLASEQAEADFIATEIKRLVAYHGGLLGWNDFVVLLRFNALSRVIEAALQKEGIPNRVLAGQKFFERLEIKDVLAYLQVIDNPNYAPAFNRAVNTPPRGIGEKSLSELSARAKKLRISTMELAERISAGKMPDIKPAVKQKITGFVRSILAFREMASKGASVPDLIRSLLVQIGYDDYLKKSQHDWETRWENVQELINFASQPGNGIVGTAVDPVAACKVDVESRLQTPGNEIGRVIDVACKEENDGINSTASHETPLRLFLQASMLSSEMDTDDENNRGEKVTISSCHSAKGLEWPVVFVPAVEKGTFPFYRSEDIEEERRLLYVACTRAQCFLYLSHSTRRMTGGEWATKDISEFVSPVVKRNKELFSQSLPNVSSRQRHETAYLLGRKKVGEDVVSSKIQEYNQKIRWQAQENLSFDKETSLYTGDDRIQQRDFRLAVNVLRNVQSPGFISAASAHTQLVSPGSTSADSIPSFQPVRDPQSNHNSPLGARASLAPSIAHTHNHAPSAQAGTALLSWPTNVSSSSHKTTFADPLALRKNHGAADNVTPALQIDSGKRIQLAAGKRRLGMGRLGTGYPNKKPKDD